MATHATGDGGIPSRDAARRGLKRVIDRKSTRLNSSHG